MGIGWMANPTEEEEKEWMNNDNYIGGRWCYIVLKPGQTIFLPIGYHSLRLPHAGPTRRWHSAAMFSSGLVSSGGCALSLPKWRNPMITNEDMEQSAPMYVHAVSKLVETRMAEGRVDELGGGCCSKAVSRRCRGKVVFKYQLAK